MMKNNEMIKDKIARVVKAAFRKLGQKLVEVKKEDGTAYLAVTYAKKPFFAILPTGIFQIGNDMIFYTFFPPEKFCVPRERMAEAARFCMYANRISCLGKYSVSPESGKVIFQINIPCEDITLNEDMVINEMCLTIAAFQVAAEPLQAVIEGKMSGNEAAAWEKRNYLAFGRERKLFAAFERGV